MGADHRILPAIKQALSMLGQAREALLFAQCPAAVAKVRRAIKSTEGALRTAKRRAQSSRVARSVAGKAPPCAIGIAAKSYSEFRAEEIPLLILDARGRGDHHHGRKEQMFGAD
jgi:hypothetical protein